MPNTATHDTSKTLARAPFVEPSRERLQTCSRCHYSGVLHREQTYPLLLTRCAIAVGLCCGVLPGLMLWWLRHRTEPTVAIICPQCDFLRLECRDFTYTR